MLERGVNSWFYSCETRTQREKETRNRWLSDILLRYKEQILKDVPLGQVFPYLVYDGVFSLKEYREILSQDGYPERVECFLLRLFSKGPGAFCAFCSHLEEFSPYLFTSLFLYYQEQTQRTLQDVLVAEEATRIGARRDPSDISDTEDRELGAQLFHKMSSRTTKTTHRKPAQKKPKRKNKWVNKMVASNPKTPIVEGEKAPSELVSGNGNERIDPKEINVMGWGDGSADNVQASELEDQYSDSTEPVENWENLEPPSNPCMGGGVPQASCLSELAESDRFNK